MTIKVFIVILFSFFVFWGGYPQKTESISGKVVKIGLLITDSQSEAAQNAAALAISMANKEGNLKNHKFQLVVRSMEGPWGTGSKQAVNLVFNEKVWAILGSHDGRNAHLVEQVIAKTHVVFLSAWASDPTLYQAYVPWFFSMVPNDLQQADILIQGMSLPKKCKRITTITDNTYDVKQALKSFLKKLKESELTEPVQLFYDQKKEDLNEVPSKIKQNLPDCIVLFGQSLTPLVSLRKNNIVLPVYGTMSFLAEDSSDRPDLKKYHDLFMPISGEWSDTENSSFAKAYKEKYGKYPGAVAAYAFDGIKVIVKAIESAGFEPDKIQESMKKIQYQGVTGFVRFDHLGNRVDAAKLIRSDN